MKKLLLSSLLGLFAITASAQDISVTLDKPAANDNIGAGIAFDWEITVKNESSTALTTNDTITSIPLFNGSPIPSGGGILGWYEMAAIPAGGTMTFTHSMTLIGGTTGTVNTCAIVFLDGDTDTTNDMSCHDVNWDAAVGIGELHEAVIENNSFTSNGVYNVSLTNVFNHNVANVSIINLNGQVIMTEDLEINAGVVVGQINVGNLARGIYIVKFASPKGEIITEKVMF